MKTASGSTNDETAKSSQNKVSKKSTKSRTKSAKLDSSSSKNVPTAIGVSNLVGSSTHTNAATTPTTPTSSYSSYNLFDSSFATAGQSAETPTHSSRLSHHKNYAGFDPRSIKIFWEQHDQTDLELSQEVCARLAEDASYKVWELINNVKIASRHSGGIVTYDLVNEVLKDADVPPMLGAMDTDWDRIEYDGSYFFHSDNVFELRDEFQRNVIMTLPNDVDFHFICPLEEKSTEQVKEFVHSLITAALFGNAKELKTAISYAFQTPLMGACYRVIVSKMIEVLAFKQYDHCSQRCWQLLRACNHNSHVNHINCRQEYFNLAEILISQLMAPYETIKPPEEKTDMIPHLKTEDVDDLKMDTDLTGEAFSSNPSMNTEDDVQQMQQQHQEQQQHHHQQQINSEVSQEQTIYKLELNDNMDDADDAEDPEPQTLSPYFASPVADAYVDELCETIGQLAAESGYMHAECIFLIKRRLARFFDGRNVQSDRDFKYISRAVRGLIALGEYAFREFIPYIYKLSIEEIPHSLWQDLAPAAIFLNGRDDIYLYEWLAHGCGADKLQPFLLHFASAYEKMERKRYLEAKLPAYRVDVRPGVRRLEWSTLAAAMCHGDDPSKALKPKPSLGDAFPDLVHPNLQLNCAGTIRFKFAGCRPVLLKPKGVAATQFMDSPSTNGGSDIVHSDILISKRKLYKPLTNVRRVVAISGYHYLRI